MAPDEKMVKGGLSLYAHLLEPSSSSTHGTISSAPVSYKQSSDASSDQDDAAKKQQALAASLHFQPTKRPQLAAQKAKAKAIASKFAQPPANASTNTPPPPPKHSSTSTPDPPPVAPGPGPVKSTIADWTADDDDIKNFYGEKRQRGGRKKRKKNKEAEHMEQNWDDIYDPSRPNNYEEYKNSEEKIREVRDWKDMLYAHRMKRRDTSDYDSDRSDRRPMNKQFAPPPSMSFAPPSNMDTDNPPPPPPPLPDHPTGDDAYARRMRLSQQAAQSHQPAAPSPPPDLKQVSAPTVQISHAPVRYSLPVPPAELPRTEADLEAKLEAEDDTGDMGTPEQDGEEPRSSRPGQKGFAERLLSKYGWTKGSGLGAQGTGIVNPLFAKVDKRKKKSDAEGGGWATPAPTAKIMGGNKSKAGREEERGKVGAMSEVAKLEGMLSGMDLDAEMAKAEGGIMQEIGEECNEKYGSVERIYIHCGGAEETVTGPVVFVKFTSQLSALRAVNALEGRIFNGNTIKARFWRTEDFDEGRYD